MYSWETLDEKIEMEKARKTLTVIEEYMKVDDIMEHGGRDQERYHGHGVWSG